MREFRKKQKKLEKIMKALVIFSAIFLFVYIGASPYIANWNTVADIVLRYFSELLIIGSVAVLFVYYSKYGKSDSFLGTIEYELSDCGFYYSAREVHDEAAYINSIKNDFMQDGYKINTKVETGEFEFDLTAYKGKEYFYVVNISDLTREDVIAHLDEAINDITVQNLKRTGNGVVCFVTNKANDSAVAISKMITPLGKKENLKIALAIAEIETGRCYFLGNMKTKCQQMIVNYVMGTSIPIDDKYMGDARLPFQDELEERMKGFNVAEFKNGTFYAH